MDHIETREDDDLLVDLGAVSEETKGLGQVSIEQENPLFPRDA